MQRQICVSGSRCVRRANRLVAQGACLCCNRDGTSVSSRFRHLLRNFHCGALSRSLALVFGASCSDFDICRDHVSSYPVVENDRALVAVTADELPAASAPSFPAIAAARRSSSTSPQPLAACYLCGGAAASVVWNGIENVNRVSRDDDVTSFPTSLVEAKYPPV